VTSASFGFELLEVIGAGSSSTIVVARRVGEERRVTLKVLLRDLSDDEVLSARTRDEARLLAQLRHPNIVTVEALTSRRGCPIVVMEHIDGVDLGTLLRHRGAGLPAADALEIVRQVATALDAAWNAPGQTGRPLRVVHRDIKPSNVLLSLAGEVKVVDFNLAAAEFEGREVDREDAPVLGSRGYAAPERYGDHATAPALDVYALGVTLVELLTARVVIAPRGGHRHDAEIGRQLEHLRPEGMSADQIERLRALVARMCAHDPPARPAAHALASELAALAGSGGPTADLPRLAQEAIPEIRRRHPRRDQDHPDWDRVAFVDEPTVEDGPPAPPEDDSALGRLLARLGLRPSSRTEP